MKTHDWQVGEVKQEENRSQIHPDTVNLDADPARQNAQFFGSRGNPQGAKLISSRLTLLPASRAILDKPSNT